jgi:NCAIR mutase (PurE)-related protein
MDKPRSLSVKDYLVRVLAVKMLTSEKIIDAVVDHQYQSTNEAMANNHSVEIAGFGKMLFNKKKAAKQIDKLLHFKAIHEKTLLNEDITETKRQSLTVKLDNIRMAIESLKPKIDEN